MLLAEGEAAARGMTSVGLNVLGHQHGSPAACTDSLGYQVARPADEAEPAVLAPADASLPVSAMTAMTWRAHGVGAPGQQPAEQGAADPAAGMAGGQVHGVLDGSAGRRVRAATGLA